MNKLPRTILTLKKRLARLRSLLAEGADESKLLKAAEAVRYARIQVLRARGEGCRRWTHACDPGESCTLMHRSPLCFRRRPQKFSLSSHQCGRRQAKLAIPTIRPICFSNNPRSELRRSFDNRPAVLNSLSIVRWWSAARAFAADRQGNSGAIPGRPRRCNRAIERGIDHLRCHCRAGL